MVDFVTQIFIILFVGSILGWVFKKFFYSSFIGYVAGGFVATLLFINLGADTSGLTQLGFLKSLGLTIFAFETGLSIGIERLLKSFNKVLVIELVSYPLLWISAKVIAGIAGLGIAGEAMLFLMLIDSSSSISIALARTIQSDELRALAVVESNYEDLAQFITFSMIFVAGVSKPAIGSIAVNILKIVGLLTLLAYILLVVMKRLRKFVLRMDAVSKYLLLLSIALLYSAVMQNLGLPPLLGSFIAGVVLSEYIGGEELTLMSGVRELGLLLYFSSLGSQLALPQFSTNTAQLLMGITIGVVATIVRIVAIMIGSVMGALDPRHILPYATVLSPVSESAIVLSDILISQGALSTVFRAVTVVAVITSMLLSPAIYRKSLASSFLKIVLPQKIKDILSHISSMLLYSSNLLIEIGRDMVKFLVVLLTAIYVLHIAIVLSKYIYIPLFNTMLVIASMAVCYMAILIAFSRVIRKMYSRVFGEIASLKSVSLEEGVARFITIAITALSTTLLISTLYTILAEANLPTPLHRALVIAVNITSIMLLIYVAIKKLRKI
uniref:Cation/H+ exchanger transmembrane domain-containing protein n=1 Tax=Ignisphaera aggregans TaxID=334771 RepID=A0A7J2U6P4_9CREN